MKQELLIVSIFGVLLCESYKVAVIEYHKEIHDGFKANIKHNLNNYLTIIDEIVDHNQKMDLIVFPEGTLVFQSSAYTKEELLKHAARLPNDNVTLPCLDLETTETSFYVQKLSCASKTHNVYISANIIEKTDSDKMFNVNIVFDRQGRLVSKYRKMKPLSIEKYISPGNTEEYFETDFGVTFGVFICFDVFFRSAFQEGLDKNVDAFIFPSYWYSELPFLSSTQVQHMWSFLHGKALLASGGNNATTGTSGTGIYSGRNSSYSSHVSSKTKNKILIAEIPTSSQLTLKQEQKQSVKHIRELSNFNFIEKQPEMQTYSLKKHSGHEDIEETLCEGEFCCKFKINVNDTKGLVITIYNGLQRFIGFGSLGIQLCAVLQCEEDSCFKMPKNVYFEKKYKTLEVQVVNSTLDADYYPNLALKDLYFMPIEYFTYEDINFRLKLLKETVGIYTFGFYGRNYKIDEL